ncbi:hypothetical protein LTR56_010125 [Elasticomyces elasticus]|nr:hypothetical protein LTR56_010125 [Elasticomyces elasticus]KAK3658883.1 hypothetical protein LTR22_008708 [Elasticomyces elasticus]KAK4923025.1 hypothetical protein LTR49_009687 [Elasticomyces elasticus]KAK5758080.1 hypothetical protein LTS12_011840 [Elasticomyces elasticus]
MASQQERDEARARVEHIHAMSVELANTVQQLAKARQAVLDHVRTQITLVEALKEEIEDDDKNSKSLNAESLAILTELETEFLSMPMRDWGHFVELQKGL